MMINSKKKSENQNIIRLEIPGISCQKCVAHIKEHLLQNHPNLIDYDNSESIDVDFKNKILSFRILDSRFTSIQLKKSIESIDAKKFSCSILDPLPLISSQESCKTDSSSDPLLGHIDSNKICVVKKERPPDSKLSTVDKSIVSHRKCFVSIQGMTCSSCVDKIESKLKKTGGIISCQIGLITARAEIDFNSDLITPEKIVDMLDDMGYEVSLISVIDSNQQTELLLDIMGITSDEEVKTIQKTIKEVIGVASIHVNRETGRAIIIYYPNVTGPRKLVDKIADLGFTVHTINSFDPEKFTEAMKKEVTKWRQSFLISLMFGVPTIISMFYFMYIMPSIYNREEIARKQCCFIPGLSMENLILFCLATPVQIFGARYFYIQAFKSLRNAHLSMDVLIMLATTIAYIYSVGVLFYFVLTEQRQSPMTFFDTPPMLLMFISLGRWLEHVNRLQTTEYIVNLMSLRPLKATLLDIEHKNGEKRELVIKNERLIDIDLVEKGDYLRVRPGERIPTDGRMIDGEAMLDESFINGESMPVAKKPGCLLLGGSIVSNGVVVMVATNVGADSQLCQIVKMVENAQATKAPIQQLADRISSYFIPFVILASLVTFIIWLWIGPMLFDLIFSLNPDFYEKMTRAEIIIQFAFQIGLSVLIISCPCALGIATPSAVIIGTGIGAINGIHIKGAEPLERAQHLNTIIFDKTGTLTYGKPSVTNLKLTHQFSQVMLDSFVKKLIILIGMAETNSDHPIAASVANYARRVLKMDADASFGQLNSKFKLETGLGIRCSIDRNILESFASSLDSVSQDSKIPTWLVENRISYASYIDVSRKDQKYLLEDTFFESGQFKIAIGNMRWMKKNNIEIEDDFQSENERLECLGETVFNVAVNGKILCLISVADTIKQEALLAIYSLRNRYGLDVMLLTGDNIRSALAIGRKVGINHIYAELLPQHKMDKIKHLQSQGLKVAMVGDGINDAPAMAQADLGIAIAKGTDITMESADIVLTKDDLLDIVSCIDLSQKTMRRIRINFLLAFIYNMVFIPIAAGVFIHIGLILQPWMSGACMAFSSISVSCSSLLLRRYQKPSRRQLETDDYLRFKAHIELQNHGVTMVRSTSINLDQISLHNAHNLVRPGVTDVNNLYRPKMVLGRESSMESSNDSNDNNENNCENVRLIKIDNNKEQPQVRILQTSTSRLESLDLHS